MLVSAASKYGATSEIAQVIADVLAGKGLEVTVVPPAQAGAVAYDTRLARVSRISGNTAQSSPSVTEAVRKLYGFELERREDLICYTVPSCDRGGEP